MKSESMSIRLTILRLLRDVKAEHFTLKFHFTLSMCWISKKHNIDNYLNISKQGMTKSKWFFRSE